MTEPAINVNMDTVKAINIIQSIIKDSAVRSEVKLKKRKITINLTPLNVNGTALIEKTKEEILKNRRGLS